MKRLSNLICLVIFNVLFCAVVVADVKVIVHSSNSTSLDQKTISRIFMDKSDIFPTGSKAEPIALSDSSRVTAEFNSRVLKKSNVQLKAYWSKLVFTGKGSPPKIENSDREVIELVKSNARYIGYVSGDAPTEGVKVVARF